MEWMELSELRETGSDLSGHMYSCRYAKESNKDLTEVEYRSFSRGGKSGTVFVPEPVVLKEDENGNILWGRGMWCQRTLHGKKFNTIFGIYRVDNHGEFGGFVRTPDGKSLEGNYEDFLNLGNTVCAVDSISHRDMSSTHIIRFHEPSKYRFIYSGGNYSGGYRNRVIPLTYMEYAGAYVKDRAAYLLMSCSVELYEKKTRWRELRVVRVTDRTCKERILITGRSPVHAQDIIVKNNRMFVSADKMVYSVDMKTNDIRFFTTVTERDEEDLLDIDRCIDE
ncbi:MAG: hypothetical protein K6E33_09345 [Lachnospiraceae bacterium]|nr:hypothetical protein [Lachnospiraceae bacterium]